MASFNYTTVEGDRIDLLAAKFYGSMDGIAMAEIPVKLTEDSKLIKLVSAFYIRSGNVNLRVQRNNAESVRVTL